jgi:hypothetical protein
MNECVGLTNVAVDHDSIFGFDPPLFQKSGMPSELLSISKVEFGQRLPGSNPASEGEAKSKQALNQQRQNLLVATRACRRGTQYAFRVRVITFE